MIAGVILAIGITAFCLWALAEVVRSWRNERKNKDKKLGLADLTQIHKQPVTYVKVPSKGELGLAEMDIENRMSAPGSHQRRIRGLTTGGSEDKCKDPEGEPVPLTDPGTPSEDFHEILGKLAAGGEITDEELEQLKGLQGAVVEGQVEKENYPYGKAYAKQ